MNYEEFNLKTLKSLCSQRNLSTQNKSKEEIISMLSDYDKLRNNESLTVISSSDYSKLSKEEIIDLREKRFGVRVNKHFTLDESKIDLRKKRFSSQEESRK